jgi:hypothetical protein
MGVIEVVTVEMEEEDMEAAAAGARMAVMEGEATVEVAMEAHMVVKAEEDMSAADQRQRRDGLFL